MIFKKMYKNSSSDYDSSSIEFCNQVLLKNYLLISGRLLQGTPNRIGGFLLFQKIYV